MVNNCVCLCCNYSLCTNNYSSLIQINPVPVWCVTGNRLQNSVYVCVIRVTFFGDQCWRQNTSTIIFRVRNAPFRKMLPIVTNVNSKSADTNVSTECLYTTHAYDVRPLSSKMPAIICPRSCPYKTHIQFVGSFTTSLSEIITFFYAALTLRRLMSYIYIYMEHPFLMFLDHTQRRSTVGRTPLDE